MNDEPVICARLAAIATQTTLQYFQQGVPAAVCMVLMHIKPFLYVCASMQASHVRVMHGTYLCTGLPPCSRSKVTFSMPSSFDAILLVHEEPWLAVWLVK